MTDKPNFDLNFSRFKTVSSDRKSAILKNSKSQNTNKATELWMKCFRDYLCEKNLPDVELITTSELPSILCDFYVEVKKKKKTDTNDKSKQSESDEYKNSSLNCIRAALNRYFRRERGLDIIANDSFIKANEMFKGVTKVARQEGRGSVEHKNPISEQDLAKLSAYFTEKMLGPPNGKHLQEVVLFNIIYYMGWRGRENLRPMKKNTFEIARDGDGRRYIHQVIDKFDKNHTAVDPEKANEARIYEQPGSDICPVACFELYLSKLNNKRDDLWQKPKAKITGLETEWFENVPVGRDMLNKSMKTLSEKTKLLEIYTNHCIHATVVTNLDKKGFQAKDIMATTGHKSEMSIRSYVAKCPVNKRREMSDALAEPLMQKPSKKQKVVTSTISVPPADPDQNDNTDSLDQISDDTMLSVTDLEIPDNQIMDILTQIENENKDLFNLDTDNDNAKANTKVVNVSNVSNVAHVNRRPLVPTMYFPNSNVTINYNVVVKK